MTGTPSGTATRSGAGTPPTTGSGSGTATVSPSATATLTPTATVSILPQPEFNLTLNTLVEGSVGPGGYAYYSVSAPAWRGGLSAARGAAAGEEWGPEHGGRVTQRLAPAGH